MSDSHDPLSQKLLEISEYALHRGGQRLRSLVKGEALLPLGQEMIYLAAYATSRGISSSKVSTPLERLQMVAGYQAALHSLIVRAKAFNIEHRLLEYSEQASARPPNGSDDPCPVAITLFTIRCGRTGDPGFVLLGRAIFYEIYLRVHDVVNGTNLFGSIDSKWWAVLDAHITMPKASPTGIPELVGEPSESHESAPDAPLADQPTRVGRSDSDIQRQRMRGIARENREIAIRNMVIGGLVAGAGLAVTKLTYDAAGSGGPFVLAWGAILFGGYRFLVGLIRFLD